MAHGPLVFVFGVLGNVVSFLCFLAPLPTFYRVCRKKSTEGFQSIPYVAALFSAMLWIYYAYVKGEATLLITINAFGCVIETIYLAIFVAYCPKKARIGTIRMILLLNFGGFCSIVLLTYLVAKGHATRIKLLGWICVAFSTSVFAAPLSIIRVVIRTKSVEFMPFSLSLLLTMSAVSWLLYGVFLKDIYVTLPNIVGLTFGMVQMLLYAIYRKNMPTKDQNLSEQRGDIESVVTIVTEQQQQVNNSQPGDIEIGQKKESKGNNNKQEDQPEKKSDQVIAPNQTEHKNTNTTNNVTTEGSSVEQRKSGNV